MDGSRSIAIPYVSITLSYDSYIECTSINPTIL